MSTPESLTEDVKFLLKKLSFLDGQDLKSLSRELGLPVVNMGGGEMAEQVRDKVLAALYEYQKMPARETEKILKTFRYGVLLKSKFLDRYLTKIKNNMID